jgi:manganese/iron transport system permease protein
MIFDWALWGPVVLAGAIAGASSGIWGTFLVGMRIPFLGVCVAHAALAGAVFGELFGLSDVLVLASAMGGAGVTALVLGLWQPENFRVDSNVVLGVLFSLSMGLAFLGLGLFDIVGRSKVEVLDLLWGTLLACRWTDCWWMLVLFLGQLVFVLLFFKELRAILFSRRWAQAAGIRVGPVWVLLLILMSASITIHFRAVGGLMIYSLLTNPAAAAIVLVRRFDRLLIVAAGLGAASGVGGFLLSLATDLPAGAMIVIVSSLLTAASVVVAWCRR